MTDETQGQQAVTVAQKQAQFINDLIITPVSDPDAGVKNGKELLRAKAAARKILASVSSASAETSVREAFSGVMRGEVVNGGAWSLHLHFGRGDGARDRMRAASSLLGSIVTASSEPVPATNQAGEVESFVEQLRNRAECRDCMGYDATADQLRQAADMIERLAALATQPATSQEGRDGYDAHPGIGFPVAAGTQADEIGTWQENVEFLLAKCPHTIRGHEGGGSENLIVSLVLTFGKMQHMLAATPTPPTATSQEGEEPTCERCDRGVCVDPHYEDDDRLNKPAATPTPPTLSEDLREALSDQLDDVDDSLRNGALACSVMLGKPQAEWLRAALAQVKAS